MQNLIDSVIRELEQRNYFEAIKYCNQLIAQFPKNYIFYEIRGNCYLETGSFVTAIQSYTEAIGYFTLSEGKSNTEVSSLYNRRGFARLKLNLYNEAINDFQKATEFKPDFAEAYNNCGNAFRKLERYDDALVQCNRAIENKPDFAEAYNNRGNIYYHFSKDNEAIYDYTRAIELKPNYAGAYYNRGAAYYYLQNKLIEAKNDWEKVIKFNPSYERELKERLDKIEEALELMRSKGEIPLAGEPLSLVKDEKPEELEAEKPEEPIEIIREKEIEEEHQEPILEIYEEQTTEEIAEEKPEEPEIEKIEEPAIEKTDSIKDTDFEIPDIDFKSMFQEEEKEIEEVDDLKPLSEIFEQIYQPKAESENIISEEVKQLHKEIEDIPVIPKSKEEKEDSYIEELIEEAGEDESKDINLPEEPGQKERASELSRLINPSYLDVKEERSIFKSPMFIIPLIFIVLVIFAVSAYLIYNKFYTKKLQTAKQEITSESKDTIKSSGNIDSTQIKDTMTEKTTKPEVKEESKQKETKEEKTAPEVTMIKNFVVIKEKDGIYLQVASLKEKSSADTKAASINKKKINANVIEADLGSKGKYYRVRIGPFKTIDDAKTAANKIE
ncbi:MAG: tetratricopeptide repeat protein [Ignavibacteriae bacterium]|nr:tetratricopeptide repeat protein [Ignavibacteriota bacterium]